MPTLKEIISERVARLSDIPEKFIDRVDKQNEILFKKALKQIDKLERDEEGFILTSEKNISLISDISAILKKTLFDGDYIDALHEFVSEFKGQAELNNDLILKQFDWKEKDLYKNVIKQSQRTTIDLFSENAIDNVWVKPLEKQLMTNIMNGARYSDVVGSLKQHILGDSSIDPKLSSYAGRVARDAFSLFDRTYAQLITKDLNVEYYEYSGGLLKDSRDFCVEREGNVYTIDEIESWANEDWQGKNPATNESTIMSYLGGYNCIHVLVAMHPDFVDEADVNNYN